ncbi:mannitol dehydrogenase family protein [Oceaniglobus roseus]|uniref:mannitol dehydrogenase family protein n=1 Tax=Oceaniglobus roseus TaxID=1737570 RepID=UPI000C7F3607|nr:mannitol dehydrogenase family protein [Kandeliimicrobium roseum]
MPLSLNSEALTKLPDGVEGPAYDRAALTPGILHIGVGNFHRAHQAWYLHRLFNTGKGHDWALIGAGIKHFDQAMRDRLEPQDWLSTVVQLDPEGLSAEVTGAMVDFLPVDPAAIVARLEDPAIRIVSLTVTEGGYFLNAAGGFQGDHPDIRADAANPEAPQTVFGVLIKALKARRDAGAAPFTVLSCDNLPENGHVARQAVLGLARESDPGLADWIEENVAFPCGMVDCITPATTQRERDMVAEKFGIADAAPVICEPFHQWVLEDRFPQGRPALEEVGVEFVDDVVPYELMKLRILNAGHAAIAYVGALLGHHFVHDAMGDAEVRDFLLALIRREAIPTLSPIPGVDYEAYLSKCAERFSNAAVGDTIPRLCLDGSNRQPKFVLPTVRDALAKALPVDGLGLEVALWCRYCAETADPASGITLEDERAKQLQAAALAAKEDPAAFLALSDVFGDLAAAPRFVEAFSASLRRLWQDGVRETVRVYAG